MPAGGRLPSGESRSWPNEGGKEGQDLAKGLRERGWPAGGGESTIHQGRSLAIQGLGLHASTAGDVGLIPGRGSSTGHMVQPKHTHTHTQTHTHRVHLVWGEEGGRRHITQFIKIYTRLLPLRGGRRSHLGVVCSWFREEFFAWSSYVCTSEGQGALMGLLRGPLRLPFPEAPG